MREGVFCLMFFLILKKLLLVEKINFVEGYCDQFNPSQFCTGLRVSIHNIFWKQPKCSELFGNQFSNLNKQLWCWANRQK